jgi:hypothetical protein
MATMRAVMKERAGKLRVVRRVDERLAALEAEVQECRQLNLRLAELVDVVAELLLPVADRDEARIAEVLQRYRESVGGPPA